MINYSLEIKFQQAEYILYSPNSGQHSFSNEFSNLSRGKKSKKENVSSFLGMRLNTFCKLMSVKYEEYTWLHLKVIKMFHLAYFTLKYPWYV